MVVLFEQFRKIKPIKHVRQAIRSTNVAMKNSRPEQITILLRKTSLDRHFLVVLNGVIQPKLTMGKTLTSFINHNGGDIGEIIQKGSGLIPGQSHQATHPLWGSTFEKFIGGLFSQ